MLAGDTTMAKKTIITLSTVLQSAITGELEALGKISAHYEAVVKATGKTETKDIIGAVRTELQKREDWPKNDEGKALNEKEARNSVPGSFFNRFSAFVREQAAKAAGKGNRVSGDWKERLVKALAKISAEDNIDADDMTISELVEHMGMAEAFRTALDKYLEA
jgi:hypothetical protein